MLETDSNASDRTPPIGQAPSAHEWRQRRRKDGHTADVPEPVTPLVIEEPSEMTFWMKASLVWIIVKHLPQFLAGILMRNPRTIVTAVVMALLAVASLFGVVVPEGLTAPIIGVGTIVLSFFMGDGAERNWRTTITGLVGGVAIILSHFGIVIPPEWTDGITSVALAVLGIFAADARKA